MNHPSRRNFLRGGLATAAIGFPTIIPAKVLGQDAPSNKIVMGSIGVGGMGKGNLGSFLGQDRAQVVAVCDVDANNAREAQQIAHKRYGNEDCRTYKDFREMLAKEKLDAVVIATPDHWHAIPAIYAARAGCDIYGEKPFSHNLRDGRKMVETVERYGRVWQTGSWQRSQGNFRRAAEAVINGRIGKVHTVEVGLPDGARRPTMQPTASPPNLDWDFWLGPAPAAPYRPGIVHANWRWLLEYGGGQMLDWIGHHLDIAHWGLGKDNTGPVEVEGWGDFPDDGINNAATSYKFTAKYADGVEVIVANQSLQPKGMGARWIGTDGWVWVDRGGLAASNPDTLREPLSGAEKPLYRSEDHHGNFLDCVISRQPTITPAETAQRSASVGHLGQIAMLTGRKIRWNPETEEIQDDPGAAALLGRANREPWSV